MNTHNKQSGARSRGRRRLLRRSAGGHQVWRKPSRTIIPKHTVSGRALAAVVAIMSFLSCLAVGSAILAGQTANDWAREISREMTIQILPQKTDDVAAAAEEAAKIALTEAGIGQVRILTQDQSAALVEPWIGRAINSRVLPIPRVLTLTISDVNNLDVHRFRQALESQVPAARLDDHNHWIGRLTQMATTTSLAASAVMVLLLAAMVFSVIAATRAALVANREVIEVLHFVGASDGFIAGEFQRHFLSLGLRGGLAGGVLSALFFTLGKATLFQSTPLGEQTTLRLILQDFEIGFLGYSGICATILLVALATTLTSRITVYRLLGLVRS